MGLYLERDDKLVPFSSARCKADALAASGALEQKPAPSTWHPNLVCVVDNGMFEGAG